jgi:tyrosyl-tRNA synthetase
MESPHNTAPHERILQKALAKEVTVRVHSESDYNAAVEASEILFKGTLDDLARLDEATFLDVFEGVPMFTINKNELQNGIGVIDFLAEKTQIFPSKGEARKMVQAGGVSVNKKKWEDISATLNLSDTLNEKYILVQKGKKNYFLCCIN